MQTFETLKERVAIITGAASGMGEATAKRLASVGMNIAVVDFDETKGIKVVKTLQQTGVDAIFVKCDITKEEQIISAIDTVVEKFGKLNVLVNCAGIGCSAGVLHEIDTTLFDRLISLNLRGSFLMMKYGVQAMLKTKSEGCKIVNFSSTAGIAATTGSTGYTVSKFGIVGLTKSGAADYAKHGITVNAVAPYVVKTGFLKGVSEEEFKIYEQGCANGRAAEPDEVACAVLYLVSDMASYINGAILPVDAGKTVGDIFPMPWKEL